MENTPKKKMTIVKKILLVIVAIPVLFILFIIGTMVTAPIFDNIDKARFETLDKQSKLIYEAVKAKSGDVEKWKYEASCDDILAGPWPTGEFLCGTSLSTQIDVTSAAQVSALHEKYYPVIDSSNSLKPTTELDRQSIGQFGVSFVVSSAEKYYVITNDIRCTYLIKLDQFSGVFDKERYGTPIENNKGTVDISLNCADKARDDWYGPVHR